MYNIPEELKLIYKNDFLPAVPQNYFKYLLFYFPELDLTIDTRDSGRVDIDSFSLDESLCSASDLTLGSCEASMLKIKINGIVQDLTGKKVIVTQYIVDGDITYEMPFGTFWVYSAGKQSDLGFKEITAFDGMKNTDIDVSAWYNGLTWPQTVKSMRESLLAYLGLEYEVQTLTNDTVQLTKTVNTSSLIGRDVLRRITEINAGFGHFTRDGKFKVIQLSGLGLYPSETLYPAEDLFPSESGEYITAGYEKIDYEEYIVEPITSVTVREDDEDTGATAGTPGNNYIITGNYLLYGKSATELQTIADNIFEQVKNKFYRPHSTTMIGLPYLEVGDTVSIVPSDDMIESFIFQRTLTGIHALKDEIKATGNQKRDQKVTPTTEIQQLKSKTLKIQRNVDQLSINMSNMEEGLQSQITLTAGQLQTQIADNKNNADSQFTQQANSIALKVSKGDVSSQLSVESGQVTIGSNRLIVDSNNFMLDASGNATFSGKVKGADIEGDGVTCTNGINTTTIKDGSLITSYINVSQQSGTDNVGITPGNVLVKNANGQTSISPTLIAANQINCGNINGGTPITTANKESQINILYASTIPQVVSAGANFRPHSSSGDNTVSCGSPSYRWTQVYAATATISTSDRALKEQEALVTEKEKKVALKIKQLIKTFKYRDAVSKKGDNARIHTGVIAQDVKEAFESEGLDPYDYALFCADVWYEKDGRACNDQEVSYGISDGGVKEVTRLGIRYEELLCFIIAAL